MSTTQIDNSSSARLRQPDFTNMSSFSHAEQLIEDLESFSQNSNIFIDPATTKLYEGLSEGIDDENGAADELNLMLPGDCGEGQGAGRTGTGSGGSSNFWDAKYSVNQPPLRQPDLNAVPPEVLASLLKNENVGNYNQLLTESKITTSNSETENNSKQKDDGDGEEKTKIIDSIISSDSLGNNPQSNEILSPNPNSSKVSQSETNVKLSPFAKEFVPRDVDGVGASVEQMTSAVSSLSVHNCTSLEEVQGCPYNPNYPNPNEIQFENFSTEIQIACLLETVIDAITQLKENPAEFDYIVKETIELLHSYLNDVSTLGKIVTMIVEESIANPNFTYTGARLCNEFVKGGIQVEGGSFKNLLLNSCHQRFTSILKEAKASDRPVLEGIHGFTMFFSELYMNLKVEKNGVLENYVVIGLAVEELLQYIAKTKKDENIKFVSQVLKLVGWQLDHAIDTGGRIKEYMDKIFAELDLAKSSRGISPGSLVIIDNLKKLQMRDWDHGISQSAGAVAGASYGTTNHIYELPEEFDEEWDENEAELNGLYLDDEPEDVQSAYEEFLKQLSK